MCRCEIPGVLINTKYKGKYFYGFVVSLPLFSSLLKLLKPTAVVVLRGKNIPLATKINPKFFPKYLFCLRSSEGSRVTVDVSWYLDLSTQEIKRCVLSIFSMPRLHRIATPMYVSSNVLVPYVCWNQSLDRRAQALQDRTGRKQLTYTGQIFKPRTHIHSTLLNTEATGRADAQIDEKKSLLDTNNKTLIVFHWLLRRGVISTTCTECVFPHWKWARSVGKNKHHKFMAWKTRGRKIRRVWIKDRPN